MPEAIDKCLFHLQVNRARDRCRPRIGRAIATKLATAGAAVMVNDIDDAALCETRCTLRDAGHRVERTVGDLIQPSFPEN